MTDINHAEILRKHADTRRRGHSVNPDVLRAAAAEIERLRAERDEARREVCEHKAWNFNRVIKPEDYARLRKWACYEQAVRRSEQNEAEVPGLRRALEAELRKAMYESEG